jgi:hypothetical protein
VLAGQRGCSRRQRLELACPSGGGKGGGAGEGGKLADVAGAARAEAGREGELSGGGGIRDPWKSGGFSPVRVWSFPCASVLVWTPFLPEEIVSSFFFSLSSFIPMPHQQKDELFT